MNGLPGQDSVSSSGANTSPGPSFGSGIGVAIVLTLVGCSVGVLSSLTLAIHSVAFGYLVYLFHNSRVRTGRVSIATVWLAGTLLLASFGATDWQLLLWHIGSIWLLRSWCYLTTVLQALVDLALWLVSLGAAAIVIGHTANLGLALWTGLLIQAIWPIAADSVQRWLSQTNTTPSVRTNTHPRDAFDESRQAAETALQRLNSTNT